ncbi:hypothetical protein MMC18_007709 [Xylographa bjoerkii]|nr:hypothetical protein [Xylographa bjoerkii]
MTTLKGASGMTEEVTDTEVVLEVQRDAIETEIPIDTATARWTGATTTAIGRAGETNHAIEGDQETEML